MLTRSSGQFYYSTLSEITSEEAKCVAWEVPGTIGTAYICVSKVVIDGEQYPVFGFQTGEFSSMPENPKRDHLKQISASIAPNRIYASWKIL